VENKPRYGSVLAERDRGRQSALNIRAGLTLGGEKSYPRALAPFGGFADSMLLKDGRVRLADTPGIGFEDKLDLMAVFRER
jgi:hypothetical protein